MKMRKWILLVLVGMSIIMCTPEPKLDYKVTKSENYKISEKKLKINSLEVKKGYDNDLKETKEKVKALTKNFLESLIEKESRVKTEDEAFTMQTMSQFMANMIEKSFEYQESKIEEMKFFSDSDVQVTQKTKIFDQSKIAKLQDEYQLFALIAQKLKYKDLEDMIDQMEKMDKKEVFNKIMNGVSEVLEDEFKKEENYTEVTSTVNMIKKDNVWHIKDLDEQIKVIENLFNAFKNM